MELYIVEVTFTSQFTGASVHLGPATTATQSIV